MLTIIMNLLFGINLFLVLIRKKPFIILPINISFILVLVSGTTKTADYIIYNLMYTSNYARSSIEIGYNLWMDICSSLGMEFNQFWLSLVLVFGGVILWVFSRYSNNYPLFFSLYYIYMLFVDVTQIRSFCATAIVTLAIHFLFQGKRVVYILLLVLAMMFHIQALFFAPLVFFDFNKRLSKKIIKWMMRIVIILCVGIFVLKRNANFFVNMGLAIISSFIDESKLIYFNTTTHYGFLLYFALHLGAMCTTYYTKSRLIKKESNDWRINFCEKCLVLQMYAVFSFPFIMVNMNFYRLYRMLYVINFISWAIVLDSMKTTIGYYKSVLLIYGSVLLYRIPIVHGNNQIETILNNNRWIK